MTRIMLNQLLGMFSKQVRYGCVVIIASCAFLFVDHGSTSKTAADLVLTMFGGVHNGSNYFNYLKAMQWIIMSSLYLAIVMIDYSNGRSGVVFLILIRSNKFSKWWTAKYLGAILGAFLFTIVAFFVVIVVGFIGQKPSLSISGNYNAISITQLFAVFSIWNALMAALGLILMVITGRTQTTTIVIILIFVIPIMVGWIYPQISPYLIGNWGMLKRSSYVDKLYGFNAYVVILFELFALIGLYGIGCMRSNMLRVCMDDGQ